MLLSLVFSFLECLSCSGFGPTLLLSICSQCWHVQTLVILIVRHSQYDRREVNRVKLFVLAFVQLELDEDRVPLLLILLVLRQAWLGKLFQSRDVGTQLIILG